jgi:hypothetical protein
MRKITWLLVLQGLIASLQVVNAAGIWSRPTAIIISSILMGLSTIVQNAGNKTDPNSL